MNRTGLLSLAVLLVGCSEAPRPKTADAPATSVPPAVTLAARPVPAELPKEEEPRTLDVKTFSFKGAVPGEMTLAQFQEKYPLAKNSDQESGITLWTCSETIANVPATAGFWFVDGILAEIFLGTSKGRQVANALKDKYGKPTSESEKVLQWNGINGTLRYDNLDDTPTVMFADKKLAAEIERRRREAAQKQRTENAKDL